ncbi:MAG TPA: hypothetical protein VGM18_11385 [Candidatus Sulfotelmatobacter sp.]|jgi:hypothetical protein
MKRNTAFIVALILAALMLSGFLAVFVDWIFWFAMMCAVYLAVAKMSRRAKGFANRARDFRFDD